MSNFMTGSLLIIKSKESVIDSLLEKYNGVMSSIKTPCIVEGSIEAVYFSVSGYLTSINRPDEFLIEITKDLDPDEYSLFTIDDYGDHVEGNLGSPVICKNLEYCEEIEYDYSMHDIMKPINKLINIKMKNYKLD